MSRYRIYLVSAVSIVILTALAILLTGSERYYPLVRVALPDKSTLVFIDTPWTDQQKCGAANLKVISAVRKNCGQCQMEESCAKQLDSLWKTALSGHAIDNYVVHSGTLRIVVSAGDASQQTCTAIVEQVTRDKKQEARCVPPR